MYFNVDNFIALEDAKVYDDFEIERCADCNAPLSDDEDTYCYDCMGYGVPVC